MQGNRRPPTKSASDPAHASGSRPRKTARKRDERYNDLHASRSPYARDELIIPRYAPNNNAGQASLHAGPSSLLANRAQAPGPPRRFAFASPSTNIRTPNRGRPFNSNIYNTLNVPTKTAHPTPAHLLVQSAPRPQPRGARKRDSGELAHVRKTIAAAVGVTPRRMVATRPKSVSEEEESGPSGSPSGSDSDSLDDLFESVPPSPRLRGQGQIGRKTVTATKAARKTGYVASSASSSSSVIEITSSEDEDEHQDDDEAEQAIPDPAALLDSAIRQAIHTRSSARRPFLLRNLRAGFLRVCARLAIPTQPPPNEVVDFTVVYSIAPSSPDADDVHVRRVHLTTWSCPLCDLYGAFPTRRVLAAHMHWQHDDVALTVMNVEEDEKNAYSTITVSLPRPGPGAPDAKPRERERAGEEVPPHPEGLPSQQPPQPRVKTPPAQPGMLRFKPMFKAESDAHAHARPALWSAPPAAAAPTLPRPPHLPAYLPDPPAGDPLGPAAQAPYLPWPPEDPSAETPYLRVTVSVRPDGPRLYDLLGALPLTPFGPLAWQVREIEEEMFEPDDVRDEDKVMQALWMRWVFHKGNRNAFVRDYEGGVRLFVDRYWEMIYLAAGFRALRVWLLMLVVNRFLDGAQTAAVLRRYKELTGMNVWAAPTSRDERRPLKLVN